MKKLLITIAAVAIATATQAAAMKWSYSSAANDATYKGSTFYLIAASALPTETELTGATDLATWLGKQTVIDSKTSTYNNGTKKVSNSYTATDDRITKSGSYYLLIVGTDGKVQTSQMLAGSTQVYDPESESVITSSVTPSGTWMTVGGGGSSGGVPEPTSGLLLLVGLAGMALKRKIA